MGILVKHDDDVLWSPSLRPGLLYLGVAAAIGERLDLEPGLPFASDEVDIELDRFRPFIGALLVDYTRSNHEVWRALLAPVLGPGIVLLDRAGHPLEPGAEDEATTLAWARETFGNISS